MTGWRGFSRLAVMTAGVSSFACLGLLVGCDFTVGGECVNDAGCPEGQTCWANQCVGWAEPECLTDADCPDGQVCQDGVCVAGVECATDADCGDLQICENNQCVTVECLEDADCAEGEECIDHECVEVQPGPAETFPKSLHDDTFRGQEHFYSAANGGFETVTNVSYTDDRMGCATCHDTSRFENADPPVDWPGTDSCLNCHDDLSDPSAGIDDARCLACHGRQDAEANALAISDVHRDAGFTCMDCHFLSEMHGDGTEYDSLLESPSPTCQGCHTEGGSAVAPPTSVTEHATHLENIDCSACHMQSVIACYNCHFESQLAGAGKRAFTKSHDYIMLANRNGKVHGATFQSLVFEQNTFAVVVPYYAHTITNQGRTCNQCHANFGGDVPAITEYNNTGTITVTTWDETAAVAERLSGPTGIIPVPEDWATAFQFAWLDYTGDPTTPIPDTDATLWVSLENGPAATTQMLFATPLTDAQMGFIGATGP